MNSNPRDSLGHTSPESTPSIPSISSNPSSFAQSWATLSPDYAVPQHPGAYSGRSSYFPPSPVANQYGSQPYATNEAASTVPGGNRVAIPRMHGSASHRPKRRSVRACESCRQRKTKCDGTRPICGQCAQNRVTCSYEPNKRIRDQHQLAFLTKRLEQYESLLRGLEGETDGPTSRRIRKVLKVSSNRVDESSKPSRGLCEPQECALTWSLLT